MILTTGPSSWDDPPCRLEAIKLKWHSIYDLSNIKIFGIIDSHISGSTSKWRQR